MKISHLIWLCSFGLVSPALAQSGETPAPTVNKVYVSDRDIIIEGANLRGINPTNSIASQSLKPVSPICSVAGAEVSGNKLGLEVGIGDNVVVMKGYAQCLTPETKEILIALPMGKYDFANVFQIQRPVTNQSSVATTRIPAQAHANFLSENTNKDNYLDLQEWLRPRLVDANEKMASLARVDLDKDGRVSAAELCKGGEKAACQAAQNINAAGDEWKRFDANLDGFIAIGDFQTRETKNFSYADKNKDNKLSVEEFCAGNGYVGCQ